ncbi:MAG TPA: inositol monophosphatase family protein, partial [Bryobacteraceae bacterium]|nr:inositol monophosphatase family protein [Bryobacteraceae bacterium]
KPWDMAAGVLLVSEAGGRVSDMNGAPHDLRKSEHVLADNGKLHDEVISAFSEIFQHRLRVPLPQI